MVSAPSGISRPDAGTGTSVEGEVAARVDSSDPRLAWVPAVLDTLLPAYEQLPGAGELGLSEMVLADANWSPEFVAAIRWMSDELPDGFEALDPGGRTAALTALEAATPHHFASIVNLAYNAYYTDPRVLEWIERSSNYTSAPPQPAGYELAPFDPAILSVTSQRKPFWRGA
jgi:hypothetical protein